VVTEQNIFNLGNAVAEAVMPKKGHMFFTNPEGLPAPEEKPDPKIEMQKEKAYMADKTKRDLAAVDLIKEVFMAKSGKDDAEMTRQAQLMDKETESKRMAEDRDFQREDRAFQMHMKGMEQEHQSGMQEKQLQSENAQVVDQLTQKLQVAMDGVNQTQQQLMQAQQQMIEVMTQIGKVMSAPKKIITDEKGEPIGVEPVLN
jgi:hypothetical protein